MAKAKKNWWFHLLKNLFTCESKSKPKLQQEKTKGWRWIFGGSLLKQLPTSMPPKSLSEAREEQRKHALNVAKATAVAAEAAVAAAQAAAEVVRLTGVSRLSLRHHEREIQNLAAIKIQTAFRGYIARKALRALKGVVRIQAIARGRAVRRRGHISLKHLSSSNEAQVVQSSRLPRTIGAGERNQSSKFDCKKQMQWADILSSKEEFESVYLKRQEAVIRRQRMKQYSFSHRERQYSQMLEETTPLRNSEGHASLRRQWAEDNVYNKGNLESAALDFTSRLSDMSANLRIKPRNSSRQAEFVEDVSSPLSHPRRSFCHLRPKPGGDDCQLSSYPNFPTYMAATKSAKAKMRSMSTPRQRLGYLDTCFEHGSWSSFNGESVSSSAIGKSNLSQLSMGVFHHP